MKLVDVFLGGGLIRIVVTASPLVNQRVEGSNFMSISDDKGKRDKVIDPENIAGINPASGLPKVFGVYTLSIDVVTEHGTSIDRDLMDLVCYSQWHYQVPGSRPAWLSCGEAFMVTADIECSRSIDGRG